MKIRSRILSVALVLLTATGCTSTGADSDATSSTGTAGAAADGSGGTDAAGSADDKVTSTIKLCDVVTVDQVAKLIGKGPLDTVYAAGRGSPVGDGPYCEWSTLDSDVAELTIQLLPLGYYNQMTDLIPVAGPLGEGAGIASLGSVYFRTPKYGVFLQASAYDQTPKVSPEISAAVKQMKAKADPSNKVALETIDDYTPSWEIGYQLAKLVLPKL